MMKNSDYWRKILPIHLLLLLFILIKINPSEGGMKFLKIKPKNSKIDPQIAELKKAEKEFLSVSRNKKGKRGTIWRYSNLLLKDGMQTENYCVKGGFNPECAQRLNKDVDRIETLGRKIIDRKPQAKIKYLTIKKSRQKRRRRMKRRAQVSDAMQCQRMGIKMKTTAKNPKTYINKIKSFIIRSQKLTPEEELTVGYLALECPERLRIKPMPLMMKANPKRRHSYRKRRRKREIKENSFEDYNWVRIKREDSQHDPIGPPISKMRFKTHSVSPEDYYYNARRNRSQSLIGGNGGDAEVESESSHDHKYANDVNPDGSTKVNLHTTGMDKFKYSGDGMPPSFGMSSYGHRYTGMPSSMRYPGGHSTRNNMKVRFDDPRYGISMNAKHQFNARHSMPMMARQSPRRPMRPPMVMRRPAISLKRSRGSPIYHGGYQGTYHGGPGYSGNSHSDYHHQIGPRFQHSYHNSHNVNHDDLYDEEEDDEDWEEDDEDDSDEEDDEDWDGMGHNYQMKYSHSNGPGFHQSNYRVQHNIKMRGNPFLQSQRRQQYYPPPQKSKSGSFVAKMVATIFVILFLMIIIL